MTRPSIWWNIGVCVASESLRKVRPMQIMRIGGFCFSIVRTCTGTGVRAQHFARAVFALRIEEERVVRFARRMVRREVERGEIVEVGLDVGAFLNREAHLAENGGEFFHHLADRMDGAETRPHRRQRDVDRFALQLTIERRFGHAAFLVTMASVTLSLGR